MGKVYLKVRKPGQTTQDGVPTDAIATVDVSGNYIVDITGQDTKNPCLLYTSPSPRDATLSRMPSSA